MKNMNSRNKGSNENREITLEERRKFLSLGLKITGVLAGGSVLSLVPAKRGECGLLGSGVIGTYAYQPHYAMLIYKDRCIDCEQCVESCRQTNNVPSYGYRITVLSRKFVGVAKSKMIREFLPVLCNHCNKPPCVRVCPTRATFKDKKNGIVMVKESLCIGCKACMTACPYNARYYNRDTGSIDKCDFCYEKRLQNDAKNTACVEACPANALFFGDLSDKESEIVKLLHGKEQEILVLRPEANSKPNVFYLYANK
ncbi:4Fe-4S dicluster domain-containing protein [Thermodesulfobacteriota bacterium]